MHVARARVRVHRLELRGAGDDLARSSGGETAADLELVLARGQVALFLGRAGESERAITAALAAPAGSALRTRALAALAVLRSYQGRGDDARALLDGGEPHARDVAVRAQLAIARAVTFWIDERFRDTAACLARALELVPGRDAGFRATVLARSMLAGATAQLGDFEGAEALLRAAEESLSVNSDLRVRADFRGIGATIAFAAGRRDQARAGLEDVLQLFARTGYAPGLGWAYAWLGRVLLACGRRRDGLGKLAAARAIAAATGLAAIADIARRSLAEDVLSPAWLARPSDELARPVERLRARLAAAMRAASTGDATRTEHALARLPIPAGDPDYALDHALAELARATLARETGDLAAAEQRLARATALAADGGADDDLIASLAALVARVRVDEPHAGPDQPQSARDLVVDLRAHLLHAGGHTVALARHPLLRAALYAFAAAPAHALDKEALAHAMWGAAYDPVLHERALKANMHRLRRLLEATGVGLVSDDGRYRLDVPGRLLVIAAAPLAAAP